MIDCFVMFTYLLTRPPALLPRQEFKKISVTENQWTRCICSIRKFCATSLSKCPKSQLQYIVMS